MAKLVFPPTSTTPTKQSLHAPSSMANAAISVPAEAPTRGRRWPVLLVAFVAIGAGAALFARERLAREWAPAASATGAAATASEAAATVAVNLATVPPDAV